MQLGASCSSSAERSLYSANYGTQVYPIQAPLPTSANAHALAFHTFMRSFAGVSATCLAVTHLFRLADVGLRRRQVWGVALGGAILQNELRNRLPAEFLAQFPQGVAIVYSAIPLISQLPQPLKGQVHQAFIDSLRPVWQALTAVCGVGLLSTLFMRSLPLHATTNDDWVPPEFMAQQSEYMGMPNVDSRTTGLQRRVRSSAT